MNGTQRINGIFIPYTYLYKWFDYYVVRFFKGIFHSLFNGLYHLLKVIFSDEFCFFDVDDLQLRISSPTPQLALLPQTASFRFCNTFSQHTNIPPSLQEQQGVEKSGTETESIIHVIQMWFCIVGFPDTEDAGTKESGDAIECRASRMGITEISFYKKFA
ncbi:hypothetical protein STEG23_035949 [Scotinomys teguina]